MEKEYGLNSREDGCWYYHHCLTCPFVPDCVVRDVKRPLSYDRVRQLKKQYPELKQHKVPATLNGKVVMI